MTSAVVRSFRGCVATTRSENRSWSALVVDDEGWQRAFAEAGKAAVPFNRRRALLEGGTAALIRLPFVRRRARKIGWSNRESAR